MNDLMKYIEESLDRINNKAEDLFDQRAILKQLIDRINSPGFRG